MKHITLITCLLSISFHTLAQEKMPVVWTQKIENKTDYAGLSDRGNYSYGADDKGITMLNNTDGSVKWSARFKDMAPRLRKIDELIPLWDANVLFIFERKPLSKDVMACIDVESGEALWTTEEYSGVAEENLIFIPEMQAFALSLKDGLVMIRARTGEELWNTKLFKGSIGNYVHTDDGHLVMINYKPTALGALFSGLKNQLVKVKASNGDVVWDAKYIGFVQKKVVTREPLVKLSLEGDKVFLQLNGLQVYDYNTGASLWSATYDENPEIVKPPKGARGFGVYGIVAEPVVVGNDVYVIDMKNKRSQYIRKYDLNSGRLLWSSPEIKGAKALPGLYVSNNRVVLQIGGVVEAQAYVIEKRQVGNATINVRRNMVWYANVKPNGLQAFDTETGKLVWESERFRKGITNALMSDGVLFVSSGKELYAMDPETGADKFNVNLKSSKIGLANAIYDEPGKILVVGANGIACYSQSDGSLLNAGIFKKSSLGGISANAYKMENAKGVAVYTPEHCRYRSYKIKKDSQSMLSNDGLHLYVYEKKTVSKLSAQ